MELATRSGLRFKGGETDEQVFVYATSCLKMPLAFTQLIIQVPFHGFFAM